MKTEIRDIAFTPKPPLNKYNLWLHFKNRKPIMELWSNGKWNTIGSESSDLNLPIIDISNPEITRESISTIENNSVTNVKVVGNFDGINLDNIATAILSREQNIFCVSIIVNTVLLTILFDTSTGEIEDVESYSMDNPNPQDAQMQLIEEYLYDNEVIENNTPIFEYTQGDLINIFAYYNNNINNPNVVSTLKSCMDMFNGLKVYGEFYTKTYELNDTAHYRWVIILSESGTLKSIAIIISGGLEQLIYANPDYTEPMPLINVVINIQ